MPKVDPSSVHRVTAKGRTYYYAWRGAGAPRLHSEPGSAAFIRELADALEARHSGDTDRIDGLCIAYKASGDFTALSVPTRANWGPWVDRIREHFGPLRIAQFGRPTIRPKILEWRDQYRATPRTADVGMQVLSRLMTFAIDKGKLVTNPCSTIPRIYNADRSDRIWRPEDLAQLEAHASAELMRAGRLAALTGLRQGDLLRLSWFHIKTHSIEIKTGKSKGRKTTLIPIYADLRVLLDSIPRTSPTVLLNQAGEPWRGGFKSSWRKACARAGIGDLHFHDLRGTAATNFYLADMSIREIAEIMTWSEEDVEALINRYVKRDELLRDRIRRLDEAAAKRRL